MAATKHVSAQDRTFAEKCLPTDPVDLRLVKWVEVKKNKNTVSRLCVVSKYQVALCKSGMTGRSVSDLHHLIHLERLSTTETSMTLEFANKKFVTILTHVEDVGTVVIAAYRALTLSWPRTVVAKVKFDGQMALARKAAEPPEGESPIGGSLSRMYTALALTRPKELSTELRAWLDRLAQTDDDRSLDLTEFAGFTDTSLSLRPLLGALRYNPWYTTLKVDGSYRNEDAVGVAALMAFNTRLTSLSLVGSRPNNDAFLALGRNLQSNLAVRLTHLDLSACPIRDKAMTSSLIQGLWSLPRLTSLDLTKCELTFKSLRYLFGDVPAESQFNNLLALNMSGNKLGIPGSKALAHWLCGTKNLRSLLLAHSSIELGYLADGLVRGRVPQTLLVLDVGGCQITDKNVAAVASAIRASNITDLDLNSVSGDMECINTVLAAYVRTQRPITMVTMSRMDLSKKSVVDRFVATFAESTHTMHTIYLNSCKIQPAQLQSLFEVVATMGHVRRLGVARIIQDNQKWRLVVLQLAALVEGSNLEALDIHGGGGVKAGTTILPVVESVGRSEHMTELDVSFNEMGDDGIDALAIMIQTSETLAHLRLDGNNMTLNSMKFLGPALKHNKSLVYFPLPLEDIRKIREGIKEEMYLVLLTELLRRMRNAILTNYKEHYGKVSERAVTAIGSSRQQLVENRMNVELIVTAAALNIHAPVDLIDPEVVRANLMSVAQSALVEEEPAMQAANVSEEQPASPAGSTSSFVNNVPAPPPIDLSMSNADTLDAVLNEIGFGDASDTGYFDSLQSDASYLPEPLTLDNGAPLPPPNVAGLPQSVSNNGGGNMFAVPAGSMTGSTNAYNLPPPPAIDGLPSTLPPLDTSASDVNMPPPLSSGASSPGGLPGPPPNSAASGASSVGLPPPMLGEIGLPPPPPGGDGLVVGSPNSPKTPVDILKGAGAKVPVRNTPSPLGSSFSTSQTNLLNSGGSVSSVSSGGSAPINKRLSMMAAPGENAVDDMLRASGIDSMFFGAGVDFSQLSPSDFDGEGGADSGGDGPGLRPSYSLMITDDNDPRLQQLREEFAAAEAEEDTPGSPETTAFDAIAQFGAPPPSPASGAAHPTLPPPLNRQDSTVTKSVNFLDNILNAGHVDYTEYLDETYGDLPGPSDGGDDSYGSGSAQPTDESDLSLGSPEYSMREPSPTTSLASDGDGEGEEGSMELPDLNVTPLSAIDDSFSAFPGGPPPGSPVVMRQGSNDSFTAQLPPPISGLPPSLPPPSATPPSSSLLAGVTTPPSPLNPNNNTGGALPTGPPPPNADVSTPPGPPPPSADTSMPPPPSDDVAPPGPPPPSADFSMPPPPSDDVAPPGPPPPSTDTASMPPPPSDDVAPPGPPPPSDDVAPPGPPPPADNVSMPPPPTTADSVSMPPPPSDDVAPPGPPPPSDDVAPPGPPPPVEDVGPPPPMGEVIEPPPMLDPKPTGPSSVSSPPPVSMPIAQPAGGFGGGMSSLPPLAAAPPKAISDSDDESEDELPLAKGLPPL